MKNLVDISLQISNTNESLTAQTGAPLPQLLCNSDTDTSSDRFSLFLILQLPKIISTVRSNNHHQLFAQLPPTTHAILATNHIRSAVYGHNVTHKSRSTTHIFSKHRIGCDVIRHDRRQLSFHSYQPRRWWRWDELVVLCLSCRICRLGCFAVKGLWWNWWHGKVLQMLQ